LNAKQQVLVYADNVNVPSENINIIKKNTEAPLEASKEDGLEVNSEKVIICSCLVIGVQKNRSVKTGNNTYL